MSTEQEDAVLLLELEEKITQRIREQIRMMAEGVAVPTGTYAQVSCAPASVLSTLVANIKFNLLNDAHFIAELTKRIGQKMATVY